MLELRDVWKEFRGHGIVRHGLRGVNLQVKPGEVVAVMGPNGAGKSTLGNILVKDGVTQGAVLLDGIDIASWRPYERAKVFGRLTQDPSASLSEALSIVEHFALAASRKRRRSCWSGVSSAVRREARTRLSTLRAGLEERIDDSVAKLSGGERQLVALSLLTISPPKVLILDEPTSALDLFAQPALHRAALDLIECESVPALWITHDIDEALKVGTRLVLMAAGRIVFDFSGDTLAGMTRNTLAGLMSELIMGCAVPEPPNLTSERQTI